MRELETAISDDQSLRRKRKAITALFPYAIWRRKNGQGDMLDAFFRIAGATSAGAASLEHRGYMWYKAEPFVTDRIVVRSIRQLNDVGVLKSYLLLLWSQRWPLRPEGLSEMHACLSDDFSGIEMGHDRMDLIRMLERFLERLDREQGSSGQKMKDQYFSLKEELVEEERKASEVLTGTHSRIIFSFDIFTLVTHAGNHSTFGCALPLMSP